MAQRRRDTVTIESVQAGGAGIVVDRATQYEIATNLREPSFAKFELGDESSYGPLREVMAIGGRYSVAINGQPRVTGRMLTRGLNATHDSGATVQLTVRTRLADAAFTTVDPEVRVKNVTLKDVILAAFAKLGYTEEDFIFTADVARDLITGKSSSRRQAGSEPLESKLDEAAPQPPESIFAFVDRHLARFRMMMWDGADGRIVVGVPDDEQEPVYQLTMLRGPDARANNILSASKTEDYEQVPGKLSVFGVGGGKDQAKAKISFVETDPVLSAVDPSLSRDVVVIDESLKTLGQAEGRARRELLDRSLEKNSWTLSMDGLSYWSGRKPVSYAVDTVADVSAHIAGLESGPYLLHSVKWNGTPDDAHTTEVQAVARGIWRL